MLTRSVDGRAVLATVGSWLLLIALLTGGALLVFSGVEAYHKRQAESWPSREATVEVSRAEWQRGMAGGARSSSSSAGRWVAKICVRYLDDERTDCVQRIRFGDLGISGDWVLSSRTPNRPPSAGVSDVIARYPVGTSVAVHHAPADRRNTVLEPRSSWRSLQISIAMGALLLGGGLMTIVGISLRNRRRAARAEP